MSETGLSEDPWRACYRQLAPRLLLFARQWVPNEADAEDVVQAAFVRFWRKQPDASPEHYPLLYAAVKTTALDLIRANSRRLLREDTFHLENAPVPALFENRLEQRETADMVQAALDCIPPEQREALVLRVWGELTFAQIAQALGESINTIASRYRYGMQAMRKHLKPYEYQRL